MPPFRPPAQVGPDLIAFWFRHYFAAREAAYPVVLGHCRSTRPDGICYDVTNWPARLAVHRLGIPAVRLIPNLAENEAYSLDDQLTAGLDPSHPEMAALAQDCARFSAEHGVELDVASTMDVTEALNLVFVPRAFQPAGDTFDDRFQFVGPLLGRREQREQWSPPESDAPVLYISLGTIFTDNPDFYRTCVEAFGDGRWQVAMTVGDVDPAALGAVPANVEVRSRFPQLAVLRQARAFVSHAGMNSTMEALSYGVPLVTFPQMPEQVANADRVTELGLGERLTALDAGSLRAAVDRVRTDAAVRSQLDTVCAAIRAAGGAARAADFVEARLTRLTA